MNEIPKISFLDVYNELVTLRERITNPEQSQSLEIYSKIYTMTEEHLENLKSIETISEFVTNNLSATLYGKDSLKNRLFIGHESVGHLVQLKNNASKFLSNYEYCTAENYTDELPLDIHLKEYEIYAEELFQVQTWMSTQKDVIRRYKKLYKAKSEAKSHIASEGGSLDEDNASKALSSISDFSLYENLIASSPKSNN